MFHLWIFLEQKCSFSQISGPNPFQSNILLAIEYKWPTPTYELFKWDFSSLGVWGLKLSYQNIFTTLLLSFFNPLQYQNLFSLRNELIFPRTGHEMAKFTGYIDNIVNTCIGNTSIDNFVNNPCKFCHFMTSPDKSQFIWWFFINL